LKLASVPETKIIKKMIDEERNTAYTSSIGRLFDCVSAMLGVTTEITYEAEAAINLEYIATRGVKGHYPYKINKSETMTVEIGATLDAIMRDMKRRVSNGIISAKFHNTIVAFSLELTNLLRDTYHLNRVCLSGGVFQNRYLLKMMIKRFETDGFRVYTHRFLPNNDGCISYGQVIAGNSAS
jgi:hydrogenase maturation protein HypF